MLTILPTDTCYGLAGDFTEQDYHAIYRLKGRDFSNRLALLVRDFAMLREYAEVTDEQIAFLKNYHNPWSVILPRKSVKKFPKPLREKEYEYISFRVAEVCLRRCDRGSNLENKKGIINTDGIATHRSQGQKQNYSESEGQKELHQDILEQDFSTSLSFRSKGQKQTLGEFHLPKIQHSNIPTLDFPLFLTSANRSGHAESTTLDHAKSIFPGIEGIDGGVCDRPPSDIFRFVPSGGVEYLRKNY